jgi:hypothetical protein
MGRTRDFTVDVVEPIPPVDGDPARYTLLTKETVVMTVLAQDPSVVDGGGPVRAGLAVPAERLQRGPRGHRFHVVDVNVGNGKAAPSPGTPATPSSTSYPRPGSRRTRSTPASTTPSCSAGSPRSWAGPRSTPRCPTT